MKYLIVLIISCSSAVMSFAQKSFDEIADLEIVLKTGDSIEFASIKENVFAFLEKGMDSLDIELLFDGPTVGFAQMNYSMYHEKFTYRDLFEIMYTNWVSKEYKEQKSKYKLLKEFGDKKVNLDTWETDQISLVKLGMSDFDLVKMYDYLKANSSPDQTYWEALKNFRLGLLPRNDTEKSGQIRAVIIQTDEK